MTSPQKTPRDFIADICTALLQNGETPDIARVHRMLYEKAGQVVPLAEVIAGVEDWKEAYFVASGNSCRKFE